MEHAEPELSKFRDLEIPLENRVEDLISRMTLEEKVSQLSNAALGISHLSIPAYDYWNESLHGIARNGRATVFPQAIGLAATWDPELIHRVAIAISDEGRAKYHASLIRNGETQIFQGLTFWSPNINIFRDPRWGRGQETFGEDPYLTSELAVAYVRGLQGDHPVYLKAAACAKHFAVHSGPEKIRHHQDVRVSMQELNRTYLVAFKRLVQEAKVEIVMGAYNALNGVPCCANPYLLSELLREDWGFEGHVVSDCGALQDVPNYSQNPLDPAEVAALALRSGCDLSCGSSYDYLLQAVDEGLIDEEEIDLALGRVLRTRFKLGMFDPPGSNPYEQISESVIECEAHRQLAYQAALDSVVMLKNEDSLLPLQPDELKNLLIVGPTATSVEVLMGNYHGVSSRMVTLLEGIIQALPEGVKTQYRMGTTLMNSNKQTHLDWVINEAETTSITIVCMGLTPQLESEEGDAILSTEEGDRSSISLPDNQASYIQRLAATGTKIILCLTGGSPISIKEIEPYVAAILMVWYPGEEGGHAVADIIFGKKSPSGKLPVTFIDSLENIPSFEDYNMQGRTYRFLNSTPAYPFGFGLSYSCFSYSGLSLSSERLYPGQDVEIKFWISNVGHVDADEVVQVYLQYPDCEDGIKYQLLAFKRLHVKSQKCALVEFNIQSDQLLFCNAEGKYVFYPGDYKLIVGGCSPGPRGPSLGAPTQIAAGLSLLMPEVQSTVHQNEVSNN